MRGFGFQNFLYHTILLSFAVLCTAAACAKDRGDDAALMLYAKASVFYEEGKFGESAALLAAEKNFSPALTLRGKALYFCDDEDGAETCLRRALRLNPSSAEASLFLARLLHDKGKNEEARALTETLLRNDPQNIRALRLASIEASARDDSESAAAFLDRAADASAETALVFIDRAKLYWTAGNGEAALEDLARAETLLGKNTSFARSIAELRLRISALKKMNNEDSQEKPMEEH